MSAALALACNQLLAWYADAQNRKIFTGKLKAGDILVVEVLPDEAGKYAAAAGAIIAEEGGLTSTAAIVAVGCGVPAIVGACGAMQSLKDGTTVTVDTVSGIVYEGTSNIM